MIRMANLRDAATAGNMGVGVWVKTPGGESEDLAVNDQRAFKPSRLR
jgi:hypothetical protein